MVEDVGTGTQDIVQRGFVSVEIRDQHFDLAVWAKFPHLEYRLRPMHRSAVREVIAIDRRDNRVGEPQVRDGLRDMRRLHRIEIHRLTLVDRAKAAMPRAGVAAEHECRRLVSPAFENVGAFGFLADGVEIEAADEFEHGVLITRVAELDLQPVGLFEPLAIFAADKFLYKDLFFDHKMLVLAKQ